MRRSRKPAPVIKRCEHANRTRPRKFLLVRAVRAARRRFYLDVALRVRRFPRRDYRASRRPRTTPKPPLKVNKRRSSLALISAQPSPHPAPSTRHAQFRPLAQATAANRFTAFILEEGTKREAAKGIQLRGSLAASELY